MQAEICLGVNADLFQFVIHLTHKLWFPFTFGRDILRDHRKLKVFHLADERVLTVYKITKQFPRSEQFGLTAQLHRAALSVPTNIVEGCARKSKTEYLNFLNIAFGSLRELGYLLELSFKLELISEKPWAHLRELYDHCVRSLNRLIRSLES